MDPVKPIKPGSPLQAALGKIVATLVEAGAVAAEKTEDRGQATENCGAKETQLDGYALLDGCDPEVLQTIVASGWLERFKDGGEMHRESLLAAGLARGNSGDFSASGTEPVASGQLPEGGFYESPLRVKGG